MPPLALDNDEQVILYVSGHPGAVGYVSAGAPVAEVKTVLTDF